ncbi:MAG: serine/threonine-protein kinase [Sterolibacterium sp.]|nr:serine/threonine-protein kinase [Sterolibacterium sp.]
MDRIGKYRIIRKLGAGATSTVYLGSDPFARREVAIKVIFPEALKDIDKGRAYHRMLVNEASLAGKLMHPHIVQIYDAVVDERLSYIVMEYVPGGTLEQFCEPGRLLPIHRLVEIIFKCSRALDYAYRMGITHRDIKPANILLTQSESKDDAGSDIKISDFGAALTSGNDQTQVTGVGSPAYMSPQQVCEAQLDHQTDIYSLGVVMYQLLCGRLPFQASNNFSMMYQITHIEPSPPSAFRSGIPASLDAIVARAMQKNTEQRYANWDEFSIDLALTFGKGQLTASQQDFSDSEKFNTLRTLPFFSAFSDVEIWEVVRFSRWQVVAPDTLIMKDGEPGDFFCFLCEGQARVAKNNHTLDQLSAGECFGEMALISKDNHIRSADVIAQSVAKIMTIRGESLDQASESCRMHFYQAFLEVLSSRLSLANIRLASV